MKVQACPLIWTDSILHLLPPIFSHLFSAYPIPSHPLSLPHPPLIPFPLNLHSSLLSYSNLFLFCPPLLLSPLLSLPLSLSLLSSHPYSYPLTPCLTPSLPASTCSLSPLQPLPPSILLSSQTPGCDKNFHKKCAYKIPNNCTRLKSANSICCSSTLPRPQEVWSGRPLWIDRTLRSRQCVPHTFFVHNFKKPTQCHYCKKLVSSRNVCVWFQTLL